MNKLEQALSLAEIVPLIPLHGKDAIIKGWPEKCSQDPEVIKKWTADFKQKYGSINYGMVCGERSGIWVLDVDDKDGKEGSVNLLSAFGEMPSTVSQSTPSGGKHYLFHYDASKPIKNGTDVLGKKSGVDVRSNRGYIAIAPSDNYTISGDITLDMADAPEDLMDFSDG